MARIKNPRITLKENGTIHIEPNGLSARGPKGATRLHGGGAVMTCYADKDDTYMEVAIEEDPFECPKLYSLVMNYKNNEDLPEEAIVTVRPYIYAKEYDEADVVYKTTFPVPGNGGKEWVDAEPVPLEIELGGLFQKSVLRITFPKVVGHLQIQHFHFVPPNADDAETEGTALFSKIGSMN